MKPVLLCCLVLIASCASAQKFKTAFDQLVYVNEQWLHQPDVDEALKAAPAKPLNEQQLIQFHLSETEKMLRKRAGKNLSAAQKEQRATNLSTLHGYEERGVFPVNDGHQNRQPYFIDKNNTYCAVGYLMQQSGADDMARDINHTQNYSYLEDINHPKLMSWAKESGLSLGELSLIQPGYQNDRPTCVIEFHYNNTGNDVSEYLELQQGLGLYTRDVSTIRFYNAQQVLYKVLPVSQMNEFKPRVLSYQFPATDSFADIGMFEFRSSDTSLVQKVIYSTDSVRLEYYSGFAPYQIDTFLVGESESTPVGTSLTFCGLSFGYGGTNMNLQSKPATHDSVNACLTLPISLGNFSYKLLDKKVQLNWETLSESNTKSFTIERSSDGNSFEAIGQKDAAGNSSQKRSYSFTDNNPRYINHYRIRQTDADGKFAYTKMLFVKVPKANPLEIIQPVVKNTLVVSVNMEQAAIKSLSLFDFSGRKLRSFKPLQGIQVLDLSAYASGSYLLQLATADGQVYSRQVVK